MENSSGSAAIADRVREAFNKHIPADLRTGTAEASLLRFVDQLLEANQVVNLVSRRNTETHVARFVEESLFLASLLVEDADRLAPLDRPARLLDIGSGGGFPGLLLKIVLPGVETVLVEGTRKKAKFLASVSAELDLRDLTVLWVRSEELADPRNRAHRPEFRHEIDWVTTKALGTLEESTRLALPFLRVGGVHWTFKGATVRDELRACGRFFKQARLQQQTLVPIPGDAESVVVGIRRLEAVQSTS